MEEMNRLDLNRIPCEEKSERILKRLNKTLYIHNYKKKLGVKKLKFLN